MSSRAARGGSSGFATTTFAAFGTTRDVLRLGEGPPVLLMPELPGPTPHVLALARRLAADGFAVALPVLFGEAGRPSSFGHDLLSAGRACVSREFSLLARHQASPITRWLRELARALHESAGGRGVGAIGLCITGNFALALMLDPWLMAPVLSQPSLPVGITRSHRHALHVEPETLAVCSRRVRDEGARVLGLRFTHDPLCPKARFDALRASLGEGFDALEIDSGPGNPHGLSRSAHSVLARDFIDADGHPTREALRRVLGFLHERLDG